MLKFRVFITFLKLMLTYKKVFVLCLCFYYYCYVLTVLKVEIWQNVCMHICMYVCMLVCLCWSVNRPDVFFCKYSPASCSLSWPQGSFTSSSLCVQNRNGCTDVTFFSYLAVHLHLLTHSWIETHTWILERVNLFRERNWSFVKFVVYASPAVSEVSVWVSV